MVIDKFNYKKVLPQFLDADVRLDPGTKIIFEVNGNTLDYSVASTLFLSGLNCWNDRIFTELKIDPMEFCSKLGVYPLPGLFPVMTTNRDFVRVIYQLFMCCEELAIPQIELMDINLCFN